MVRTALPTRLSGSALDYKGASGPSGCCDFAAGTYLHTNNYCPLGCHPMTYDGREGSLVPDLCKEKSVAPINRSSCTTLEKR
jgi:hypothetical protein